MRTPAYCPFCGHRTTACDHVVNADCIAEGVNDIGCAVCGRTFQVVAEPTWHCETVIPEIMAECGGCECWDDIGECCAYMRMDHAEPLVECPVGYEVRR